MSMIMCLCSCRLCDGVAVGLSLCSDDETDLIRELQTMCSSKSEPDISKVIDINAHIYYCSKAWGWGICFKNSLTECSPQWHLLNQKYSESSNIVKYYYSLK